MKHGSLEARVAHAKRGARDQAAVILVVGEEDRHRAEELVGYPDGGVLVACPGREVQIVLAKLTQLFSPARGRRRR